MVRLDDSQSVRLLWWLILHFSLHLLLFRPNILLRSFRILNLCRELFVHEVLLAVGELLSIETCCQFFI